MDKHLSRKELIALARKPQVEPNQHLETCDECRAELELLRAFQVAGRPKLQEAPRGWVERAAALALRKSPLAQLKKAMAALVFDSWAAPQPIGVRGAASTAERRLRFETEQLTFDLRAEQLVDEWVFVAQVSTESKSLTGYSLSAQKQIVTADKTGLFQWTSKRPPKKIILRSEDTEVEVPELSWTKNRPR